MYGLGQVSSTPESQFSHLKNRYNNIYIPHRDGVRDDKACRAFSHIVGPQMLVCPLNPLH